MDATKRDFTVEPARTFRICRSGRRRISQRSSRSPSKGASSTTKITPMSTFSAVSLTNWRGRFREEWHIDFEYRENADSPTGPGLAVRHRAAQRDRHFLRRDQLLKLKQAPFNTGTDSVIVAYAANAEMSCFLALGWPFPVNILDLYVETIAAINGDTTVWLEEEGAKKGKKGRPGLLTALKLHGLRAIEGEEKEILAPRHS